MARPQKAISVTALTFWTLAATPAIIDAFRHHEYDGLQRLALSAAVVTTMAALMLYLHGGAFGEAAMRFGAFLERHNSKPGQSDAGGTTGPPARLGRIATALGVAAILASAAVLIAARAESSPGAPPVARPPIPVPTDQAVGAIIGGTVRSKNAGKKRGTGTRERAEAPPARTAARRPQRSAPDPVERVATTARRAVEPEGMGGCLVEADLPGADVRVGELACL